MQVDMDRLAEWIGRTEGSEQVIAPERAAALAATLDREQAPAVGDPLPPLWHWIYFTPLARQSDLGLDGHPRLGGFLPPVPLPRRMWAGGRLRFATPIRLGELVARESEVVDIRHRRGQQGDLVFVTVRHRLSVSGRLAIEEEQDIVYRDSTPVVAGSSIPDPVPAADARPATWQEHLLPTPPLLFRYSALTFNTHRIHYDLPYAIEEEGYPGLVVHGPLTATLLAEALGRHLEGEMTTFSFRAQRPLFCDRPITLCGRVLDEESEAWAQSAGGGAAMTVRVRMSGGNVQRGDRTPPIGP